MQNNDPSLQSPQDANTEKHINFNDDDSRADTSGEQDHGPAKQQWEEMRGERMNNDRDPSLGAPQEANTQKHINFLDDDDSSSNSGSSEKSETAERWEEMRGELKNNDRDPV